MDILETAIRAEDGVGKLAEALGVKQNVVSNWRARGIPKPWSQVLHLKYGATRANSPQAPATAQQGA